MFETVVYEVNQDTHRWVSKYCVSGQSPAVELDAANEAVMSPENLTATLGKQGWYLATTTKTAHRRAAYTFQREVKTIQVAMLNVMNLPTILIGANYPPNDTVLANFVQTWVNREAEHMSLFQAMAVLGWAHTGSAVGNMSTFHFFKKEV